MLIVCIYNTKRNTSYSKRSAQRFCKYLYLERAEVKLGYPMNNHDNQSICLGQNCRYQNMNNN